VQRSTGSWSLRPVRRGYRRSRNPYEWCGDEAVPLTHIADMQPIDVIVAGMVAVAGYTIVWVVRHERAVRRFRSQPPA
jgi:hypothetical protein